MRKSLLLIIVFIICVSVVMATSLYGGKGDTASEEEAAAPGEKTVLRMWSWNNEGDYPKVFELIIARFEEMHPCLLYTSPSPRDRTRSRMPSSA